MASNRFNGFDAGDYKTDEAVRQHVNSGILQATMINHGDNTSQKKTYQHAVENQAFLMRSPKGFFSKRGLGKKPRNYGLRY